MSKIEENLDEKIARIRKQNEAIIQREKLIKEDIKNAERNNAIVKLKPSPPSSDEFGSTLYADRIGNEKRLFTPTEFNPWEKKLNARKNVKRNEQDDIWREERKQIDQERINRQKADTGTWRREWDAEKIILDDESLNRSKNDKFNRSIRKERENFRTFNERGNFNYNQKEFYSSNSGNKRRNEGLLSKTHEWKKDDHDKIIIGNDHHTKQDTNRTDIKTFGDNDRFNNNNLTDNKGVRYSRWRSKQNISPLTENYNNKVNDQIPKLSQLDYSELKNIKKTISCDTQIESMISTRNIMRSPLEEKEEDCAQTKSSDNSFPNIVVHVNDILEPFSKRKVHVLNEIPDIASLKLNDDSKNICNGAMTFERSDLKQTPESWNLNNSIASQTFSNSKIDPLIKNNDETSHEQLTQKLHPKVEEKLHEDEEWEDVSDEEWEDISD